MTEMPKVITGTDTKGGKSNGHGKLLHVTTKTLKFQDTPIAQKYCYVK